MFMIAAMGGGGGGGITAAEVAGAGGISFQGVNTTGYNVVAAGTLGGGIGGTSTYLPITVEAWPPGAGGGGGGSAVAAPAVKVVTAYVAVAGVAVPPQSTAWRPALAARAATGSCR